MEDDDLEVVDNPPVIEYSSECVDVVVVDTRRTLKDIMLGDDDEE
ncbi:MAG: hypothetical protein Q9M11_03645 [Mariprofundaceae bacterium]|nr:hypothetical protein [Mariprofundaceae bacterium]